MLRSLYSKIAAGLAGLFLLVGLLFVGVTVFSTDMYQQEVNQKLNTGLARQIVNERLLMQKGRINTPALKDIFHMLMVINPGIEIYLLDVNGRILTYSAPEGSVMREAVDLGPVLKWLKGDLTVPVQGDDPKSATRKKVFSAAPIRRGHHLEGYLYVILGGEEYDSVAEKLKTSYVLQLSLWMIGAGLVFALVAGLALFGLLTGRLRKLASVMTAFKKGKDIASLYKINTAAKSRSDEIDELGTTFWEMAGQIDSQMKELRAADRMRRELVANVSHDLRTPLATLQGYIETLLIKENRYTWTEQKQYLEIAISHCRRLNTLVGELLELARLESAAMDLKPESFNFRELVEDVLQKFSLRAREKQIRIHRQFDPDAVFVTADIALVERALENLMDNAVHYTPPKGEVRIRILPYSGARVRFEIRDTGPGIPPEELPHIFERFYRTTADRNRSPGHSGLGLAITRKVITLHGQDVRVSSEPGKGTLFSFALPGTAGI